MRRLFQHNLLMKEILFCLIAVMTLGCAEAKKRAQELKDQQAVEDKEFIEEIRSGAEKGKSNYQFSLAVKLHNGDGVEKNEKEALKWFLKAAEQGNSSAQTFIGSRYWLSEGFPQDLVTAYAWIIIAAKQKGKHGESARKRKADWPKEMTPDQITKAEALAEEMIKKP